MATQIAAMQQHSADQGAAGIGAFVLGAIWAAVPQIDDGVAELPAAHMPAVGIFQGQFPVIGMPMPET